MRLDQRTGDVVMPGLNGEHDIECLQDVDETLDGGLRQTQITPDGGQRQGVCPHVLVTTPAASACLPLPEYARTPARLRAPARRRTGQASAKHFCCPTGLLATGKAQGIRLD